MSLAPRYLRPFAEQRLDDEIVYEDEHRLAKNVFRPYGVVSACPLPVEHDAQTISSQVAGIIPFK